LSLEDSIVCIDTDMAAKYLAVTTLRNTVLFELVDDHANAVVEASVARTESVKQADDVKSEDIKPDEAVPSS